MNTTKKLSVASLKKLMNETYNWEQFAKFLFDYGTLLMDSDDQINFEREQYYKYKDNYFYFAREKGEITKVGWSGDIDVIAEHWQKQGITHIIKTDRMPLGKVNSNVRYIIKDKPSN